MLAPAALQVHMSLAGRSWDLGIRLGRAGGKRKKAMRDDVCLLQERETHLWEGEHAARVQLSSWSQVLSWWLLFPSLDQAGADPLGSGAAELGQGQLL